MPARRRSIAAVAAFLAVLLPSLAAASIGSDLARIKRGLTNAQSRGWLKPADTERYRRAVGLALLDTRALPKAQVAVIGALLSELAAQSGSYTSPRALALFSMLETNLEYLETHIVPRGRLDLVGEDGVVYRWFAGRGFQFHPLADFGALNGRVSAKDVEGTRQLADALLARGIPRGPATRWEYYFPFGRGRPPWTSGMAQAVAAQAFARASALLSDPSLLRAAGRAYAAVPGRLVQELAEGPWIRLYSFDRLVVLNAQLQAIVSLQEYAEMTGDAGASALASAMSVAAQTLLPRFDTGYWSLYALGGVEAPLEYQRYVAQLLIRLAQRTQDPFWQDAAARFRRYVLEPPQLTPVPLGAPVTVWSKPLDNYLDTASVTFTISKRSKVTLSAGGRTTTATVGRGTHTFVWKPDTLAPGTYAAQLNAVDLAGNRAAVPLDQPFVVAWDTAAPQVQAQLAGNILTWQANDPGTPWLKLRVVLRAEGAGAQVVELGRQPLSGSLQVTLPPGTWQARLGAQNSAGRWATVELGLLVVPPQR
jgi:hypothetical protein